VLVHSLGVKQIRTPPYEIADSQIAGLLAILAKTTSHGTLPMSDNALSTWIGRTEEIHDHISLNLVTRIAATLGERVPHAGEPLPALWQWCFFQPGAGATCGPP